MDFTILHFAIHIVWRVNVICICRKPDITRKTTVAYPELRFIGLAETQAQSFTYHPLKGFHGDTISFLKSNFYDQRNYFVGKKFEVLLELYMREMPLKGCYAHGTVPYSDPNNDSFICGAWLRPMDNFFCQKTPLSLYMQPHLT